MDSVDRPMEFRWCWISIPFFNLNFLESLLIRVHYFYLVEIPIYLAYLLLVDGVVEIKESAS